jgi:uncharacterized protein involved in cysteine biosynthesis
MSNQQKTGFDESLINIEKEKLKLEAFKVKNKNIFWNKISTLIFNKDFYVFVIMILLIIIGLIVTLTSKVFEEYKSFWSMVLPFFGTFIGYLFGKNSK